VLAALVVGLTLLDAPAHAADPKEVARQHFVAGLDAAARKDYRLAIGEFMASYESSPHPTTAKNIARAYHDLGDLNRARLWYRRFQQLDPSRASEVAADLLKIEEALDPIPPEPSPAAAPATAPEAAPPPAEDKPSMADVLRSLPPKKP
jgi:tetratricopeptide (TPR) repeat protein